jgi:hypothetical protein
MLHKPNYLPFPEPCQVTRPVIERTFFGKLCDLSSIVGEAANVFERSHWSWRIIVLGLLELEDSSSLGPK